MKKDFIEDFYEEYGFYPPESVNSWEEWDESQKVVDTKPKEFDKPINNN